MDSNIEKGMIELVDIRELLDNRFLGGQAVDAAIALSFYRHNCIDEEVVELFKSGINLCKLIKMGVDEQEESFNCLFDERRLARVAYCTLMSLESVGHPEFKPEELVEDVIEAGDFLKELLEAIEQGVKKEVNGNKLRKLQKSFLDVSAPFFSTASTMLSSRWP